MTRRLRPWTWFVIALVAGCPRPPGPLAAPLPIVAPEPPRAASSQARARFDEARARFERAEYIVAASEFAAIARDLPDDPIAPTATLYAGAAALRGGDPDLATKTLAPLASAKDTAGDVGARARFYLGLADGLLGRHAEATALLAPLEPILASGPDGGELYAALAEAAAAMNDAPRALRSYDGFFARATAVERSYIRARLETLVGAVAPETLAGLYAGTAKTAPSAAMLARRLADRARAEGKASLAERLLAETAAARAALGAPGDERARGPANGRLIGALLPLSGKRRLVGEAALRGLAVAAGSFAPHGGAPLANVAVADCGETAVRAGDGVDELAQGDVVAIVGPFDKDAIAEAARRAAKLRVPLVTLDMGEVGDGTGPFVFRIAVSIEARARALARAAHARGARRFAILAPSIAYGTRAAAAFREEVARLGDSIEAEATYAKDATAFVTPVKKLAAASFDAVFVPDTAAHLELIAAQLAASNLVVAPAAGKARRGRSIMLLATGEALSPRFLRSAGRYTVGAILAPGFYPDDADPTIAPYATSFRAAFGEDATYLDAYAYDAALVVAVAARAGADADGVRAAIATGRVVGLTGEIRFDAAGQRADEGTLWTVVAAEAGSTAIRAIKTAR